VPQKIRIAIAGVGNCASSLLQGVEFYRRGMAPEEDRSIGLMHYDLGGYRPEHLEVVAAFDIDARKVGRDVNEAIFAPPNCTQTICADMPPTGVRVEMGPVYDGVAAHMKEYAPERTFVIAKEPPADVEKTLRASGAEILLNYMPVGSEEAARFYARSCLHTGVSFINCMPVFVVSNPEWEDKFRQIGIPVIGDDIKAQVGATITHRTLAQLFRDRGVKLDRTYQLNTGGNTDFLNMLARERLASKKVSKTDAVQSVLAEPLSEENIHIGPSDYVPWQNDNKVCFLRMEGRMFGGVKMEIELRLSVEDSPNSAGVAIDAVRLCRIARDRKIGGALYPVSAYLMKHPPRQMPDTEAQRLIEEFVGNGESAATEELRCTA